MADPPKPERSQVSVKLDEVGFEPALLLAVSVVLFPAGTGLTEAETVRLGFVVVPPLPLPTGRIDMSSMPRATAMAPEVPEVTEYCQSRYTVAPTATLRARA